MRDIKECLKKEIEEDFKRWWIGDGDIPVLEEMIIKTVDRVFRADDEGVAE